LLAVSIHCWSGIRSTSVACLTGVAILAYAAAAAGEPQPAAKGRPIAAPHDWAEKRPVPPVEHPDDKPWTGWLPAARNIAVYDRHCDRFVRFDRERVWSYSLRRMEGWSVTHVAGELPPPRWWAAQVYDRDRNRVIVHGGTGVGQLLDDTWQLSLDDPPTWSRLVTRGEGPKGMYFAAIYDPVRRQMIVSGGYGPPLYGPRRDVWALTLQGEPEWRRLSASGPQRAGHAATYDPVEDRMIVFGGGWEDADSWDTFNDVWAFSLAGDTWRQLHAGGRSDDLPPRRAVASLTYDPVGHRLILVGGLVPGAEFRLDERRWQPIGHPKSTPCGSNRQPPTTCIAADWCSPSTTGSGS